MDLLKLNLFRGSIFKQIKFLFTTPQKSLKVLYISEAGSVSQELLPIETGFVSADSVKKAWTVMHNLKCQVKKKGETVQDELVLPISDRSFIPLDPNGNIKVKEKEQKASLKDIAGLRHAEERADIGKEKDERMGIAQTVIVGSFILLGLMAILYLIITKFGGSG